MARTVEYDAVVVGSGPNGLAAAVVMAQAGRSVLVLERNEQIGGGVRSAEVTLPGFVHDICSAIHPLAAGSPFFRRLPLHEHGLEWIHPDAPLAHPFDDGTAAVLERSVEATGRTLGEDADAWRRLMQPLTDDWPKLESALLGPLRWPRHPFALARFGLSAIRPARALAEGRFRGEAARGLFAGIAAHSFLPLERRPSAAFGLVLGVAGHAVGWPMPRGGAGRISAALASYLKSLGGEIVTGTPVESIDQIPSAAVCLFDVGPRQLAAIAGDRLPPRYRRSLERYRYGPGVFKIDWALDGPVPWKAEACRRAGTVHLGGTLDAIAASERAIWGPEAAEQPFVLLAQQSLFDETRAPEGQHTVWAYCHVPSGSTRDMTGRIERQIERFAPGFRDRILARTVRNTADMERENPNYIGGDVNGGVADLGQLFTRPTARLVPYATPDRQIYLCSASTPPGGGVHGMCGYHAARAALWRVFRQRV